MTTDATGAFEAELRYTAFGETRYATGNTPTNYRFTGQLSASIGLYNFKARWYDPQIGHFVQSDTIVPKLGNPLAWDRYAYSINNPIRYSDPSGFAPTPAEWSEPEECQLFSCLYHVVFTGNWTYRNMKAAIEAVKSVGSKIAKYIGGTATSAFNTVFGRVTFGLDPSLNEQRMFGQTSGNVINFQPGIQITPRLVTHELGHAFEQRIWENNGEKYAGTNNPVEILITKGVWDDGGNLITGTSNKENSYLRYGNTGGEAPYNGYTSNDYRTEAQWHPKGMEPYGNTAGEDWADIFMNWVFGTFAPGPAGTALNNWTTTNMAGWISEASK